VSDGMIKNMSMSKRVNIFDMRFISFSE